MDHEHHHMIVGAEVIEPRPDGHGFRDIETSPDGPLNPVGQLCLVDDRLRIQHHVCGYRRDILHDLTRFTVDSGIHRPQRLMPGRHVEERRSQRVDIQWSGQPGRETDVVCR